MTLVQSRDIYHGLPTFPDKGLTAIVTGANGISGHHMLKVLCEAPERWTKIYALSRRLPHGTWPAHVEHVSMDFLKSAEELAEVMTQKNLQADYVFFFAYIQPQPKEGGNLWSNAEELVRINTQMLGNFLEGQALSNTIPRRRIHLQLGAKYYGLHLGPNKVPQEESDPRVHLEPNFYYDQEDLLKEFAKKHNIGWNTTRPSCIAGAVPDAAMNLCLPLAIYATVQKHLDQPSIYPSDFAGWTNVQTLSSAPMNGYLAEWAVLTDGANNESFNASDDSPFSWETFWPRLAARFGLPYKGPDLSPGAQYKEIRSSYNPPPRGYGPVATPRFSFTLTDWAKRPEVQAAWEEIATKHGLKETQLKDTDRIFSFTDMALSMSYPIVLSTAKAKKLGFFGFVDSGDSIIKTLEDFVVLGMIPPF